MRPTPLPVAGTGPTLLIIPTLLLILSHSGESEATSRSSPIRRGLLKSVPITQVLPGAPVEGPQEPEGPGRFNLTLLWPLQPINEERHLASLELSRNMSLTLENLLRDYDHHQRPGHGDSPTVVTTNMLIRSMGPISELDMAYSMDCYFRQKWTDKRLQFEGPVNILSLNIKMLEKLWKPDTYFHNGKGSYLHTITRPNKLLRILRNGEILYSMRLTVKARCPMALHYFPMDVQSCPLIFGSYGYPLSEMEYRWDNVGVSLEEGQFMSQFDLIDFPYRNFTVRFRRGVYSALQVNFNLRRHTGYFLIQVYVPCTLIVVLSWVSFWINREATADRIGLGITTVLTLSTFVLDTKTDLPKVSYPTALDWFVIMSFVFVISTLLEFAGVHYFTKVGSGEFLLTGNFGGSTVATPQLQQHQQHCKASSDGFDAGSVVRNDDAFDESDPEDTANQELRFLKTPEKPQLWGTHLQQQCYTDNNQVGQYHGGANKSGIKCRVSRNSGAGLPVYPSPPVHHSHSHRTQNMVRRRKRPFCCFQLFKCIVGSQKYRESMRRRAVDVDCDYVNSVSRIDRVSRVCFPLSFIILNLFYWFFYCRASVDVPWQD